MPRLPRYAHPQAARRLSGKLSWRPGWQGTGQQPIRRVPVAAYTRLISGVPLNGGQAQGRIAGYTGAAGSSVLNPIYGQVLASVTLPAAGTYTVAWTVTLAGTLSSGDANNFALYQNSTPLAISVNAATAASYPQAPVTVTAAAGDVISVQAGNATSGAVYGAALPAPAGTGTLALSIAPQGLGTVWYPVQVTLSTATGALDTSLAAVYLGPAVTPATLVGQLFSGNGTVALAIPNMTPGQTLIITWTGGHPGDIAAANVIGTMSALSTQ